MMRVIEASNHLVSSLPDPPIHLPSCEITIDGSSAIAYETEPLIDAINRTGKQVPQVCYHRRRIYDRRVSTELRPRQVALQMRRVVCVKCSYRLRAQYFCVDFVGMLVPEVFKQPRIIQMNLGVHDDSVDTILPEHVLCVLE